MDRNVIAVRINSAIPKTFCGKHYQKLIQLIRHSQSVRVFRNFRVCHCGSPRIVCRGSSAVCSRLSPKVDQSEIRTPRNSIDQQDQQTHPTFDQTNRVLPQSNMGANKFGLNTGLGVRSHDVHQRTPIASDGLHGCTKKDNIQPFPGVLTSSLV